MPVRAELRAAALRFLPPSLVDLLRGRFGEVRFGGDYASWSEALAHSRGYAAEDILARVVDATLAVRSQRAAFERDGLTFDRIEHSWPVLASLLWVGSLRGGTLHVLDFGGSLGSSYQQNRDYLSALALRWSVVEQPHFVAAGRERFASAELSFHDSVESCLAARGRPDVLLLSSVLPYVQDPYGVLDALLAHAIPFVIVDRTPMLAGIRDRLTVQQVSGRLGQASYPAWFFARTNFLRRFEGKYRLREEFDSLDHANIASRHQGFLFELLPEHARHDRTE